MQKREKIIISLALLSVVGYGVYMAFPSKISSEEKPGYPSDKLKRYLNQVDRELSDSSLSEAEAYVVHRVRSGWSRKLFSSKAVRPAAEPLPTYSGYLAMGDKMIAVIDGAEYEVGEEISGRHGYIVEEIRSGHIVIGLSGKKSKIIPIVEGE